MDPRRQADERLRVTAEAERITAERDCVAAGQNVTETVATLGILLERMENPGTDERPDTAHLEARPGEPYTHSLPNANP